MEQQQPPPETQGKNGKRGALNFIVFAARGLSLGTTVFIRRNFGLEGIGMPGIGTIAVIIGFGYYGHAPIMMYYLYAWIFATLMQRVQSAKNRRKGVKVHSYWPGDPFVGYRLGAKDHLGAISREILFCILFGIVLVELDPAMGAFVVASAIGTAVNMCFNVELDRARKQQLQDAMIEAEYWSNQQG